MEIKKDTILDVKHDRSGRWTGIATEDFDTEKDEFYPIALHQEEHVSGLKTIWSKGDNMPCRGVFCKVKPLEE